MNLTCLEPTLYPGQQPLQPEVLLRHLGVVDGHARHFLFGNHLPSPEDCLALLLQDVAPEESARVPAKRNHLVQRRMLRPGVGHRQPQQHADVHRLCSQRGGC